MLLIAVLVAVDDTEEVNFMKGIGLIVSKIFLIFQLSILRV